MFLFGQYDNDLRKQKSMAGTKEKLLKGIWCTKAPIGYDNVKRNGERFIEINEKGKLIRKAFLWKANENIPNTEVVRKLSAVGFKLTPKMLFKVFRNPFYCGLLSHTALGGEMIQGKHEALVSKEVFLKVNDVTRQQNYGWKHNADFEATPLKNTLRCDVCGEYMRGYIVKAKRLFYYKCDNKKQCSCNKNAIDLHKRFENILGEINLQEKYIPLFKQQMKIIYNELNENRDKLNDDFNKQLSELNTKIERLEERFVNEEIKTDLYEKFSAKFKQEYAEIKQQIAGCPITASNLENYINRSAEFASQLPSLWASGSFEQKQKLQKLLFKDGIYYNKQKDETRTTNLNSLFSVIASLQSVSSDKNKKPQGDLALRSLSVARTRFELVTSGL